jgi:hypothetical protein
LGEVLDKAWSVKLSRLIMQHINRGVVT